MGAEGDGCRLLQNNQHACSEKFILKCLEQFKAVSQEIALKRLKEGIKPDDGMQKK
jgi:hypothetical protein